MSNYVLFIIIICYLAVLFYIAFLAEKNSKSKWVNNPYIYTLSLAVYCSAWTYYGSIGVAANSGINFLPIYLGPVIAFPLWIVLLRKVMRISKQHKTIQHGPRGGCYSELGAVADRAQYRIV